MKQKRARNSQLQQQTEDSSGSVHLIRNQDNDENYKMPILIAFGCFWGLRISGLLNLKLEDVLQKEDFIIVEVKTQKKREIKIATTPKPYCGLF